MSNDILSTKVSRALSVRTDTPAMLSALEALAGLGEGDSAAGGNVSGAGGGNISGSGAGNGGAGVGGSNSIGGGGGATAPIDPRSIRSTIEQSALLRALKFQSQLQKLADAATTLRIRAEGVERCAEILEWHAGRGVGVDFVGHDGVGSVVGGGAGDHGASDVGAKGVSAGGEEEAFTSEQTLATTLYQAHRSYLASTKRRIAVEAFLEKFDLNEEETRLLDTYEFEGTQSDSYAFLNALERLALIRRELSKTFGAEKSEWQEDGYDEPQERIGTHSALRMMEQLALRQEKANERLYQFIQMYLGIGVASSNTMRNVPTSSSDSGVVPVYEEGMMLNARFRDGDDMDEAYADGVLRKALHVLRNSRERHVHALEMIGGSRRAEVTRRFLLALTNGYGGLAPLEMRAHDPVGYVGDMLAFAFRSFRVEGELVKTLFVWEEVGSDDVDAAEHASESKADENVDEEEAENDVSKPMNVVEILSQSMGGLARPLGTRIKQVVKSLTSQRRLLDEQVEDMQGDLMDARSRMMMEAGTHDDDEDVATSSLNQIVALFSICGLLKFYSSAVQNALEKLEQTNEGAIGSGESAKNPLFTTCVECLMEASESYVASLRTYGAMLSNHTSPNATEAVLAQRLIVRVAEERVASPGFADDSSLPEINVSMKQLSLSFLVRTLVDAAIPYLKSLDDGAALKSAMSSTVKCGLESTEAKKWIDLISEKETELVEELVETEAEKVLSLCGLSGIQLAMQQMDAVYVEGMTMSSHPGLSQSNIETAMKQFYSSLYSPPIPTFEDSIKDPELRKSARSKTAKRVVKEYQVLYDAITSEKGGYADLSFLGHDPDQVNTLLSL